MQHKEEVSVRNSASGYALCSITARFSFHLKQPDLLS